MQQKQSARLSTGSKKSNIDNEKNVCVCVCVGCLLRAWLGLSAMEQAAPCYVYKCSPMSKDIHAIFIYI